jgi:hypothetical protein
MHVIDKLTIVIPYSDGDNLIPLLDSIQKQQIYNLSSIIIANCSGHNPPQYLNGYRGILQIQIIKGSNISNGKNRGAMLSDSPYILFLEPNIELVEDDILLKAIKVMVNDFKDVATCKLKVNGFNKRIYNIKTMITKKFSSGFFMVRKFAFINFGRFSESYNGDITIKHCKRHKRNKIVVLDRHIDITV